MTVMPSPPRAIGPVNWIGLWTLYRKEVQRFLKVFTQTIAAPVVTTLLFFAVFSLALGGVVRTIGDVAYLEFLAPGLVMMAMAQNAFANTSSSVDHLQGPGQHRRRPDAAPERRLELAVGLCGRRHHPRHRRRLR